MRPGSAVEAVNTLFHHSFLVSIVLTWNVPGTFRSEETLGIVPDYLILSKLSINV